MEGNETVDVLYCGVYSDRHMQQAVRNNAYMLVESEWLLKINT